jgi:hypothetical protein
VFLGGGDIVRAVAFVRKVPNRKSTNPLDFVLLGGTLKVFTFPMLYRLSFEGSVRAANKDRCSMKPRTAFIVGCFIVGGIGVLMMVHFGWQLASSFPSADLAQPLRERASDFVVSAFVVGAALQITGFIVGMALIGFAIFTAMKNLRRPPSAINS